MCSIRKAYGSICTMNVDAFGVPDSILGRHEERFYGAVGRIACLAALVEQNLLHLHQALYGEGQEWDRHRPAGLLARQDCDHLASLSKSGEFAGELHAIDEIFNYLKCAIGALERRHVVVHSAWPAQRKGDYFRHRPVRKKESDDTRVETVNRADATERLSFDWFQESIEMFVELTTRFNQVHSMASRLNLNSRK